MLFSRAMSWSSGAAAAVGASSPDEIFPVPAAGAIGSRGGHFLPRFLPGSRRPPEPHWVVACRDSAE